MQFLELLMKIRTPALDYFMLGISYIGTPVFITGLIVWIYLNINKRTAYGITLSFLVSGMICQGLKVIFRIPRPWILQSDTSRFFPVEKALATATGYSFPSIHSQSAAAFCESVVHYNKKKPVIITAAVMLFLIPFSRMYLGCHTPLDITVGFGVGTLVNLFIWNLWNRVSRTRVSDALITFFLIGFALILIFLGTSLSFNGTVEFTLMEDSLKTAGLSLGFAVSFFLERHFLRFTTDGSLPHKLVRFLIALGGFLLISALMKQIAQASAVVTILRYGLGSFWLFGITPLLCVRLGIMKTER